MVDSCNREVNRNHLEDIRENNCKAATIQVTKYWKSEHSDEGSKRKYGLDERSTLLIFAIQTIFICGGKIICYSAILVDTIADGKCIRGAGFSFSCRPLITLEEWVHINIGWYHCAECYLKPYEAHINDEDGLVLRFNTNFIHALSNSY